MTFFKRIAKWIEYGSAEPIANMGRIYAGSSGKEKFTADAKLMRDGVLWVLRMDLQRRWGTTGNRAMVDCYFRELQEIKEPFAKLLRDVAAGVVEANSDVGMVPRMLVGVSAGKIIRGYGRIDNHPKNAARFHAELFLSQQQNQYWLILAVGRGSVEWSKWPIGVAESIEKLFGEIGKLINGLN